jgi:hypothetical protein
MSGVNHSVGGVAVGGDTVARSAEERKVGQHPTTGVEVRLYEAADGGSQSFLAEAQQKWISDLFNRSLRFIGLRPKSLANRKVIEKKRKSRADKAREKARDKLRRKSRTVKKVAPALVAGPAQTGRPAITTVTQSFDADGGLVVSVTTSRAGLAAEAPRELAGAAADATAQA